MKCPVCGGKLNLQKNLNGHFKTEWKDEFSYWRVCCDNGHVVGSPDGVYGLEGKKLCKDLISK